MSKTKLVLLLVLLVASAIVLAQDNPVVFTGTAIASQGTSQSMSARVNIRVVSYTPKPERQALVSALQTSREQAMQMLRSSARGYINIEGHAGRTVEVAYWLEGAGSRRLVLIGEHQLSDLEKQRGEKQENYPLSVVHIDTDLDGTPIAGEFFPAVQLAVTPAGFLDVQTNDINKVILFDLKRQR